MFIILQNKYALFLLNGVLVQVDVFQIWETESELLQFVFIKVFNAFGLVVKDQRLETFNFDICRTFGKIDIDIIKTKVFELLQ
jgi:hypothetical protein